MIMMDRFIYCDLFNLKEFNTNDGADFQSISNEKFFDGNG